MMGLVGLNQLKVRTCSVALGTFNFYGSLASAPTFGTPDTAVVWRPRHCAVNLHGALTEKL